MSIRKRFKSRDESNVDMTPMLDIVFIMLIFFIVPATFLNETGLDFSSANEGATGTASTTIQVYVDNENNVSVEQIPTELINVPYVVERFLSDKPGANILLSAHYDADLNPVVNIQDAMNAASRKTVLKVVRE